MNQGQNNLTNLVKQKKTKKYPYNFRLPGIKQNSSNKMIFQPFSFSAIYQMLLNGSPGDPPQAGLEAEKSWEVCEGPHEYRSTNTHALCLCGDDG